MPNTANIQFRDQTCFLSGELDFTNVMAIYRQSLTNLSQASALSFDFAGLTSSSSAALALIIQWIKLSQSRNKSIRFTNLSKELMSLADVSGLGELIK